MWFEPIWLCKFINIYISMKWATALMEFSDPLKIYNKIWFDFSPGLPHKSCASANHTSATQIFLCNHAPSFYPRFILFPLTCRWTHFMFRQSTPAEVVQFREQVWISLPFLFSSLHLMLLLLPALYFLFPFSLLLLFTSLNSSPSFSLSLLLLPSQLSPCYVCPTFS